ncbi:MAG: CARDB domain-containing protein [Thermodesulfobacteriota bacterium]
MKRKLIGWGEFPFWATTIFLALTFSLILFNTAHSAPFSVSTIDSTLDISVMEVEGNYDAELPDGTLNSFPRQEIATNFFKTHPDDYDFLVIFSNYDFAMPADEVAAFYLGVKNDVQGIGKNSYDNSSFFGSNGNLQGTIDMGNLSSLSSDPLSPNFSETMGILSHELLHRWAAQVKYQDSNGAIRSDLIGKDGNHWSYLLDTDGSLEYGNQWMENGDGTFTSLPGRKYFSQLDLYLMGLADRSEVPPMLLIQNPDIDKNRVQEAGVIISGAPQYITIDDIIAAEGERIPGFKNSQKSFNIGAIYITRPGTYVQEDLHKIRSVINNWQIWFSSLTNGRSTIAVDAPPNVALPANAGPETPSYTARSAPPQINDGVTWLINNQLGDGSWQDSPATLVRDTSTVLEALHDFTDASQAYISGIQLLSNTKPNNSDYRARKLETLSSSGNNVSELQIDLYSLQNEDGGWGGAGSYVSNPTDTALTLKALTTSGFTNQSAIEKALEYLKQTQNSDDGWGGGGNSNIQTTIDVITVFVPYRTEYHLDDFIQNAVRWLYSKQNEDGGFGNSPSTIYNTAETLIALKQLGISSTNTDQAVSYILGRQDEDGSWYSSAYQTALAVNSLWAAMRDPDLSVSTAGMIPSPSEINLFPAEVSLSVSVQNSGMTDVQDTTVVLYEGAVTDSSKIAEKLVSISSQSSTTVVFNTTIKDGNAHYFYAVVDPENLIKEASEQNNSALRILYSEPTYDFEILPGDISVVPVEGNIYEPLTISGLIKNNGTVDAYNVPLNVLADNGSGPIVVVTKSVDLPSGETTPYSIPWVPEISGLALSLSLVVDPHRAFTEVSEVNNSATVAIDIHSSTKPDLYLSYADLSFDPDPALEAGSTVLKAQITNKGFAAVNNVQVDFYERLSGEEGSTLLGSDWIPVIAPGQSVVATLDWDNIAVSGKRLISVDVDPLNLIDEIREDDNSAFTLLEVLSLPDLAVADSSIAFSTDAPKVGDLLTISTIVQNGGEQPSLTVPVAFYAGNTLLGISTIPPIEGNDQEEVLFIFDTAGKVGVFKIRLIVDPENTLLEQDKENNRAGRSIGIQNKDLWLSENFISPNGDGVKDSTDFGYRLNAPQNVRIVVVNEDSEFVREFTGPQFNATTAVAMTWDGLDNKGMVVDDGQYRLQVLSETGTVLAGLLVTVDNNRSPLLKAIGTPYLHTTKIDDLLGGSYSWFPDDSGVIFHLAYKKAARPEYDTGIYTMSPTGGDITRLVPDEWSTNADPEIGYRYLSNESDCKRSWQLFACDQVNPGFALSADGNTVAFILEKYTKSTGGVLQQQLWSVNRFGEDLTLLDSFDYQEGAPYLITDIFPSPDGTHIAYKLYDQDAAQHSFIIIRNDGTGKTTFAPGWNSGFDYQHRLSWAPDGQKLVFSNATHAVVADLAGNLQEVLPIQSQMVFFDWFGSNRILIRDRISWDIVDSWSVDLNAPEFPPVLIAAGIYAPEGWFSYGGCLRRGTASTVSKTPLHDNGYFIAGFEEDWPFENYIVCDINGNCQDTDSTWLRFGKPSLTPDTGKLVNSTIDGIVTTFDRETLEAEVFEFGSWERYGFYDIPSHYKVWPPTENDRASRSFLDLTRWNWFDNETFLAYYFGEEDSLIAFNIENGERTFLLEDTTDYSRVDISPDKRYLTFPAGNPGDIAVLGSLLNLTAELQFSKTRSGVYFSGIASDLNFSNWVLEYADRQTPDDWRIIAPASEKQVVDGSLSAWIPPYEGSFLVRLTVTDKAGNTAWDRRLVTWGKQFSVTNIYQTGELFSPNDDGTAETVSLNYFTHDPVHLELFVYDAAGNLIKTYYQNHALPGEYGIVWDGLDESGGIVPDGDYSIKIFDYEFFFEVDTTLPDSLLEFGPVSCGGRLRVELAGLALDKHFKSWTIFYGDGDSPQEWYEFKSGQTPLAPETLDGRIALNEEGTRFKDSLEQFTFQSSPSIGFLVNKTFRLVVEDSAGNKSIADVQLNEEMSVMAGWDNNRISLEKNDLEMCSSPDILPIGFLGSAVHDLTIYETMKEQISSATVQYRMNMQWFDGEALIDPPDGEIHLAWDNSLLNHNEIAAVRIKFLDVSGLEYYSNSVSFRPPVFTAEMGCKPITLSPAVITMNISLPEDLAILKLQAQGDDLQAWVDFDEYEVIVGPPFEFAAPSAMIFPEGYGYPLRFVGIGESGRQYISNEMETPPSQCSGGAGSTDKPGGGGEEICRNRMEESFLTVRYSSEKAECNSVHQGPATIALHLDCPDDPNLLKGLDKVSYFLEGNGEARVLKEFDPVIDGWGEVVLDTSSLQEGDYKVRVDLIYGTNVVEAFMENILIVDRTLPEARLEPFCARNVEGWHGREFRLSNIAGVVDDLSGSSGYTLIYGPGSNPQEWFSIPKCEASWDSPDCLNHRPLRESKCNPEEGDCPTTSSGQKDGLLGVWDVTTLQPMEYSLQLMATDKFGNKTCVVTQAQVEAEMFLFASIDRSVLSPNADGRIDKAIFSPNGDGIKDEVPIGYQVVEKGVVDVSVWREDTLVRSLLSGQILYSSSATVAWDGLDNAGATVADGLYQVKVTAQDSCANVKEVVLEVTVDNTPPVTAISALSGTGEPLDVITGTAYDIHLASYQLRVKGESGNGEETLLNEGEIFAENVTVGVRNTFGLEGNCAITLSATDQAGNLSTTSIPVSFGSQVQLISKLAAEPYVFSPNGDGKLDDTIITYELVDFADITLVIEDKLGNIVTSDNSSNSASGSHQYQWDGLAGDGSTLPDGNYTLKISAASVSQPQVVQVEKILLTIDTTDPEIIVTTPLDGSYYPDVVTIQGSLSDYNLNAFNVSLSGEQEETVVDTAVNSHEIVFSQSVDLVDGNYQMQVAAKDSVENESSKVVSFTVDKTPPLITLESPVEDDFFGGEKADLSIKGVIEEINLLSYRVQYGFGENPAQWVDLASGESSPPDDLLATWFVAAGQGIDDGDYTLRVTAVDKAGWESEALVSIHVDNTAPDLAFTVPEEGVVVTNVFDVIGTVNDRYLQEFTLQMADSTCSAAEKWSVVRSGTQTIQDGRIAAVKSLPADGSYCLWLSAFDFLGNTSSTYLDFIIDTTSPVAPVLSGHLEAGTGVALNWQGNIEPDLVGYNLYRNNEKINFDLVTETEFMDQALLEGEYTYTVRAVDLAGWESIDSNQVVLTVDLTPPAAMIASPREGALAGNYLDIIGRAYSEDDFKEYRVSFGVGENPETWQVLRKSPVPVSYGFLVRWDVISLADGLYSIKLEAEDLNGNVNEKVVLVSVDNTPPASPVLLSAIPDNLSVDLTWQANSESDLAGYLVYRNGHLANEAVTVIGDLFPYLITGLDFVDAEVPDGSHDYYLIAMDNAGNMSDQSNIIEVSLDNHAPHLSIISPTPGLQFDRPIIVKAETEDTDITTVQFQYQPSGETVWYDFGAVVTQRPYVVSLDPTVLAWVYGTYRLRAVATDLGGRFDEMPEWIEIKYTDITPPAGPTGVAAQVAGGFVALSWNQNQESDLAGYNVYIGANNVKRNTVLLTETGFSSPAGTTSGYNNGEYQFKISAVDESGNESDLAPVSATIFTPLLNQPDSPVNNPEITVDGNTVAEATVEIFSSLASGAVSLGTTQADFEGVFSIALTLATGDNDMYAVATDPAGNISRTSSSRNVVCDLPPATPAGLKAIVNDYDVDLSWDANLETDLLGYNIYRDGGKINVPVPASGTYSAYPLSNNAYKAFDGNSATYWSSYSYTTFPSVWWEINFGAQELLTNIEIEWGGSENSRLLAGKDYEIQAWSAIGWKSIAQVAANGNKINTFTLEPSFKTDRIRIYITATTDPYYPKSVRISEVRIFKERFISPEMYKDLDLADGEYSYQISAVDGFGSESLLSPEEIAIVGDVTPPAAPENLLADPVAASDIELTWTANTEPDLAGYNIYRTTATDWQKINTSSVTANTYTDLGLQNAIYTYRVTALDNAANESGPSNESTATIERQLSLPPTNLTVSISAEGMASDLCWDSPIDPVAGYGIYRSETSGGPYAHANTNLVLNTCYHDQDLTNGTTYFYVVRAVDPFGNESTNSNEDSATPVDGVVPDKPFITLPTVTGRPYQSSTERVDVSGFAEPGASVDLIQDQVWIDTVVAQGEISHETFFLTDNRSYETVTTPDGRDVYYVSKVTISNQNEYYTFRQNLETGAETRIDQIPEGSWNPVVSPDGSKIAYLYVDSAGWVRIGVYNLTTGIASPLTADIDVDEWDPAWSRDSTKIVFDSDRGNGVYDIWIHDLPSGETSRVTQDFAGFSPEISPDGKKVAFLASSWANNTRKLHMYLVDTSGGTPVLIAENVDWTGYYASLEWSPLANKLAFTEDRDGFFDIYVFDADTGETSRLTDNEANETYLQWSPDGKNLAYYLELDSGTEVRMVSFAGQAEDKLLHSFKESFYSDFQWLPTGIFYRVDSDLHHIVPEGSFSFTDVRLNAGENIFTATATDGAGNVSPPAEEILVSIDLAKLTDIEVLDHDIYIMPNALLAGETATLGVQVWNKTAVAAENIAAEIYVWDANDNLELIHSETISYLGPFSEEWLSVNWDSTGMSGLNTIYVLLDPDDEIIEVSEGNNLAAKDFYVASSEGLQLTTRINGNEYSSDEYVSITVELFNSGLEQSSTLDVLIEDPTGYLVDVVKSAEITLPYGGSQSYSFTWKAGSVYAGNYQVRTVIKADDGTQKEENLPFTVLPDTNLQISLGSDRLHYGPNELVHLTSQIDNLGSNYIIPVLDIRVSLASANGELHAEEQQLTNLFTNSSASLSTTWSTAYNLPGDYTATVIAYRDGLAIAENKTSFQIDSVFNMTGNLGVAAKVVPFGSSVSATYSLHSNGNLAGTGLALEVMLLDSDNLSVIDNRDLVVDLAANDSLVGAVSFAAADLYSGNFKVLLFHNTPDGPQYLDSDTFSVMDTTAPVVEIIAPVTGGVFNQSPLLSVKATDNSTGVDSVEYSIGNDNWLPLPAVDPVMSIFSTIWQVGEYDEGVQIISFRAMDRDGNSSLPVTTEITLTPEVELAVSLTASSYLTNEDLVAELVLSNFGWAKTLDLQTWIEDSGGSVIYSFNPQTVRLLTDESRSITLHWNVGATYAGVYTVHSLLSRNNIPLTEQQVTAFEILPAMVLNSTLQADKSNYTIHEDVLFSAAVESNGNFIIPGVSAELLITDLAGDQVHSEVKIIENFAPGTNHSLGFTWNTAQFRAGSYVATLNIMVNGQMETTTSEIFTIDPALTVSGGLALSRVEVAQGETIAASYDAVNKGNILASALPLRLVVYDGENIPLVTFLEAADLDINDTYSGEKIISTAELGIGSYRIAFEYNWQNSITVIGEAVFTVIDTTPPVVELISPASGGVFDKSPLLSVKATDDSSGVNAVEYRIDNSNWLPLSAVAPAASTFSTIWQVAEHDEGAHTISFRATDQAGNSSDLVTSEITLVAKVDLSVSPSASSYQINGDMAVELVLSNHGWPKTTNLQTWIEDASGKVVYSFNPQTLQLLTNEVRAITLNWNVGTTYAGTYTVHSLLSKTDVILAEQFASFKILPAIVLDSTLQADKPTYSVHENVLFDATVESNGNFIISTISAELIITGPGGGQIHSEGQTLETLVPGTNRAFGFTWNTAQFRAGSYVATLNIMVDGQIESTISETITIEPVLTVSGNLALDKTEVPQGETFVASYDVTNKGNVLAEALPLRLVVYDGGNTPLVTFTKTTDFDINDIYSGEEVLSTEDLGLGAYRIALEYHWQNTDTVVSEAGFSVIDNSPPEITVISPQNGAIFEDTFDLGAMVTDDSSGVDIVEYQLDDGIWQSLPISAPPTALYAYTWVPVMEDEGEHTVVFRATDKAGNIAISDPATFIIELCKPFAELTGSLNYQPQTLYYGQQMSFAYELVNSCAKDITGLTTRLIVKDPATAETVTAITTTVNLSPEGKVMGDFNLATLDALLVQSYGAVLQVEIADQLPRELAVVNFTVLPALDVSAQIIGRSNLLVWINYQCESQCGDDGYEDHDDSFDKEEDDDEDHCSQPHSCQKNGVPCIRQDLLEPILAGATDFYHIVHDRREFEEELRNPLYTDILILGDQRQLTDHLRDELREKVFSGTGLVASGWLLHGDHESDNDHQPHSSLLGVKGEGKYGHDNLLIMLDDSPVTAVGELPVDSKSWKIEVADDALVAGWFVDDGDDDYDHDDSFDKEDDEDRDDDHKANHDKGDDDDLAPAIVLHDYGLGRTVYLAFDYGLNLTEAKLIPMTEMLQRALGYVHFRDTYQPLYPYEMSSVEIEVESPGRGFDLRFTATCPLDLRLYDPATGSWSTDGLWQPTMSVEAGGTSYLPFYVFAPEQPGSYDLQLHAIITENGQEYVLQNDTFTFDVSVGRDELITGLISTLEAYSLSGKDRAKARKAGQYLAQVRSRIITCENQIEKNLHDLEHAVEAILAIEGIDMQTIRLELDSLLRIEQSRWYFYTGPLCEKDEDDD